MHLLALHEHCRSALIDGPSGDCEFVQWSASPNPPSRRSGLELMIGNPSEITPSGRPGRYRSDSRRCVVPGTDRHLGRRRTLGGRSPPRGPAGGQRLGQGPRQPRWSAPPPTRSSAPARSRATTASTRWPTSGPTRACAWSVATSSSSPTPTARSSGRRSPRRHRSTIASTTAQVPAAERGRRRHGPGRRGRDATRPGARDLAPRHRHPAGVRGRGPRHRRRRGVVAEGLGRRRATASVLESREQIAHGSGTAAYSGPNPLPDRDQRFGQQLHHDRPDGDRPCAARTPPPTRRSPAPTTCGATATRPTARPAASTRSTPRSR